VGRVVEVEMQVQLRKNGEDDGEDRVGEARQLTRFAS
jgi:hypothetical protein